MRLFYLSTTSLLAAIFFTLNKSECSRPGPGRHAAAQQGGSESPSQGRSLSEKPSLGEDIGKEVEGISENAIELEHSMARDMKASELLRMDREKFEKLRESEKVELMKDLTAEEWNELLGKFCVEGGNHGEKATIFKYTSDYSKERLFRMFEEALKKNLEHLFREMCDLAYVPKTPKVMGLLEEGLNVYPRMRRSIVLIIYRLGHPVTKWHLGNTQEDVDLLKVLVEDGYIKSKAAASHLAQIAALYPSGVLRFLIRRRVITRNDLCTMELYRKVCGLGGVGYLQWAEKNCKLTPDQGCIDAAVSGGHEDVVKVIAHKLGRAVRPNQKAVNEAAANGQLTLLANKCTEWGLFPTEDGADGAAENGHLKVLGWMTTLELKYRVYPNLKGADWAAQNGHLEVLKWMATLELKYRVYPSLGGANMAAMNGHLKVLEWMVTLEPEHRVYPCVYSANLAAQNGQLEVLKWMATLDPDHRVYPSEQGADWAVQKGHRKVVEWLAEQKNYPKQPCVDLVTMHESLKLDELLDSLKEQDAKEHKVSSNQGGADCAADNVHPRPRRPLNGENKYQTRQGADQATGHMFSQMLMSLDSLHLNGEQKAEHQRVYPNDASLKTTKGHQDILRWLDKLGAREAKPNEDIITKLKLPNVPSKPMSLKDLQADILNGPEGTGCPTTFLNRIVALRQIAEDFWSTCLKKLSAYSQNQEFFKSAIPAFAKELERLPVYSTVLKYTANNVLVTMEIFCEENYLSAFLQSILEMQSFTGKCTAFEGLSDEFLTLTANYMRSTINFRKLYFMLKDPRVFTGSRFKVADDSISKSLLLNLVVKLRKLVNDLNGSGLVAAHHRLSSALEATKKTMVPANRGLVSFLTDFLSWEISSLADKAGYSLSTPCNQAGLTKHAQGIIADIGQITTLLQHGNFNMNHDTAEQQGVIEISWNNFLARLLALEANLAKSVFESTMKTSETLSKLIDNFLDTFSRGEDEAWTCRLYRKLNKAQVSWESVLCVLPSVLDSDASLPLTKYLRWVTADFWVILNITSLVESLEDPLALDTLTREKLVEYWREAQALLRLSGVLSMLRGMRSIIESMQKRRGDVFVRNLLHEILDGEIDALEKRGIHFEQENYHQFIDELPEHQHEMAQSLKEFSDLISGKIARSQLVENVEVIFSGLTARMYKPLKQALKKLLTNRTQSALQSPPQILQLHSLPSPMSRANKKKSKKKREKPKQTPKNYRQSADPKEPIPAKRQTFVRGGLQYVNEVGIPNGTEESCGAPWSLVTKLQNLQTCGGLVRQPAKEVLKRFRGKPRGWDGVPPTDPQDTRSDKTKVKIAAFNVEWLFFFDLATDKLRSKVQWTSLLDAWDHIRDVADVIKKIDVDILCLCEVQDLRVMSILVGLLPELNYRAYLIPNHDSFGQNVAILTRVDTLVSISRIKEAFFPKNILLHLKLANGCGGMVDLVLSGVHLISSTAEADPAERARLRANQAKALKKHLANTYGPSKEAIHLVLGDFNMADPEVLSANSSCPSETALDIVKHEAFDLSNAIDPTKASRDLVSRSVCHIFTSHPNFVADSEIVGLGRDATSCRLERVSDHPLVMATIRLPN